MKPVQLGNLNAELPPLEEDLAARLDVIFERCPKSCARSRSRRSYNEIAVALLDFMFERPSAKEVLRGRTFVRTLH